MNSSWYERPWASSCPGLTLTRYTELCTTATVIIKTVLSIFSEAENVWTQTFGQLMKCKCCFLSWEEVLRSQPWSSSKTVVWASSESGVEVMRNYAEEGDWLNLSAAPVWWSTVHPESTWIEQEMIKKSQQTSCWAVCLPLCEPERIWNSCTQMVCECIYEIINPAPKWTQNQTPV